MIIIKIYTYNIYNRSFLKFVQLRILIKDSRIPNQKQKNQNEILTKKKTRHEINNLIKLNWRNTDTGLYGIKHIFLITTMWNFFPSYNLNKNLRSWNMYRNYYLWMSSEGFSTNSISYNVLAISSDQKNLILNMKKKYFRFSQTARRTRHGLLRNKYCSQ